MNNAWRFRGNELKYLSEVLGSGESSGTTGNMNKRFEQAFAEKTGAVHAVTFNSGTSTLHAALHAMGVGAGDEVITTPLTVISNADVVLAQNAIPVFADIQEDTFNIDPKDIERKITAKTKAIMPVSLYGLPCDLEAIRAIGRKHGIPVLHDAAQAHMAEINGVPINKLAEVTSYSLENTKHIATGDGGIQTTDDARLAALMRKMGSLGYAAMSAQDGRIRLFKKNFQDPNYKRHDEYGHNYRMPEVAAAVGLAQVERIEQFVQTRIDIAGEYLKVIQGCDYLIPQAIPAGYRHVYWCFPVKFARKDITWYQFRDKYEEFGGDGIYAAWALLYEETLMASGDFRKRAPKYYDEIEYKKGLCPVAEKVQPQLMQFINNYENVAAAAPKVEALAKTIAYFN